MNLIDPSGHDPEWWQWLLGGIGLTLIAVAAGMAFIGTGGVAAFGMGALIGAAAVGSAGALIGGAIGYATGGTEGILGGALTGFGIGAIIGFAVGGVAYSYSGVTVDMRKFTEYALDPLKSKGKHNVFNDLGYYKENAHKLVKLYKRQGYKNWMKGAYELHQLDQHGQRITICIKVRDQVLKTGWMLVKHGIRLVTPFSGFG